MLAGTKAKSIAENAPQAIVPVIPHKNAFKSKLDVELKE